MNTEGINEMTDKPLDCTGPGGNVGKHDFRENPAVKAGRSVLKGLKEALEHHRGKKTTAREHKFSGDDG